jgi:hypothetical protein
MACLQGVEGRAWQTQVTPWPPMVPTFAMNISAAADFGKYSNINLKTNLLYSFITR